ATAADDRAVRSGFGRSETPESGAPGDARARSAVRRSRSPERRLPDGAGQRRARGDERTYRDQQRKVGVMWVGIDLGLEYSRYSILGEDGELLEHGSVRSTEAGLR